MILLTASAISAVTGDATSSAVIAAMVLMSVTLDFVQEYRAGLAAEKLARQVALRVRVVRDAREQEVSAETLVPGDVLLLSAGDLVPADARVLQAQDFFVNQALLMGNPIRWNVTPGRLCPMMATGMSMRPGPSSWEARWSAVRRGLRCSARPGARP